MDTKKVVGVVVILVAVIGLVVVYIGLPATKTSFHYERQYPSGETRYVRLRILDFDTTPTDISISYVDDPTLMYSIDVEQYEPGSHHQVTFQEWENDFSVSIAQTIGGSQTSLIDITLGTGTYYDISIDSHNLDVIVTYDNGAVIDGQNLHLSGTNTTLEFVFTENVDFTDSGLEIRTLLDIDVVLDIDLPDGMNGLLTIPSTVSFSPSTLVGWTQASATTYETASTAEPLLDFSHENAGTISGSLQN